MDSTTDTIDLSHIHPDGTVDKTSKMIIDTFHEKPGYHEKGGFTAADFRIAQKEK